MSQVRGSRVIDHLPSRASPPYERSPTMRFPMLSILYKPPDRFDRASLRMRPSYPDVPLSWTRVLLYSSLTIWLVTGNALYRKSLSLPLSLSLSSLSLSLSWFVSCILLKRWNILNQWKCVLMRASQQLLCVCGWTQVYHTLPFPSPKQKFTEREERFFLQKFLNRRSLYEYRRH